MTGLVLRDLRSRAGVWTGSLAVMIVTGCAIALCVSTIRAGFAAADPEVLTVVLPLSAVMAVFTAATALVVLGSTSALAVDLHRRDYALWQVVGVRPAQVTVIVLAQLSVLGVLGGGIGTLLGLAVRDRFFRSTVNTFPGLEDLTPALGVTGAVPVLLVVGGLSVLGGLRGAIRAGTIPAIEVLRDADGGRDRRPRIRLVVVVLLGALLAVMAAKLQEPRAAREVLDFAPDAMTFTPLLAVALAVAGPLLHPAAMRVWTAVVPASWSASWFLARTSARFRVARSAAAVSPLMIAVATAGGFGTLERSMIESVERGHLHGAAELGLGEVILLLGTPLVLCAVGAAATVLMTGQDRDREHALVRAAGARSSTVLRMALGEAVIHAGTATLLGGLAVVVGALVVAGPLGLPAPVVAGEPIALTAGAGFLLLVAATLVPTARSLRRSVPGALAAE